MSDPSASPRRRVADLVEQIMAAVASEYGFRQSDLSVALHGKVHRALAESYRRGAFDTHERATVHPPTEEP